MNGRMKVGLVGLAAVALAVAAGLLASSQAYGQQETITIDSAMMTPGQEGAVYVDALGIPEPGLGAWTVDISYDTAIATAVACLPENGGVCNPAFDAGVIRVTGASAMGVVGDNSLVAITFRCDAEGTTALSLDVPLLVDATIGAPQPINAIVQGGTLTCTTSPGNGGGEDIFDCDDFVFQDTAQAIYDADPTDPNNLDPDGDGVACAALPSRDGVNGLPIVGINDGGVPTSGMVLRWLSAALAGIGFAALGSYGVLRFRTGRAVPERIRRD
jgi:hypothetical protein